MKLAATLMPLLLLGACNGTEQGNSVQTEAFNCIAASETVVTPGECSDGMSDRTYPFTVTLLLGEEQRTGCAWTDLQPYSGPETP